MKLVIASLLFVATAANAEPTRVSMQQAVDVALKQHPSLRQNRAAIDAAEGRIDLAKVPLRPTVSVSASLTAGSSRPAPCAGDMTMTCGGFFDPTASTGLAAVANWRIWDFGATKARVREAELNAAAIAAAVDTTTLDIRRNVEVAYLEAVARQRLVVVSQATVQSEELHLDQAKKFVAAQAKDPIEVVQAQARAANARSTLAQARAAEAVALASLRSAIGWADAATAPAVVSQWPVPSENDPPQLGALVDDARKHRPEIAQLDRQILAAEAGVDSAYADRRPVLSATAQTQWSPGTEDWRPQPSWSAGLTLSWMLWDGGRSSANAKIARANVAAAMAERDALLVELTSGLEAARAEIIANRAAVDASREAVTAAQAQLKLAEARYKQGLGSQIELADAQTAVTTAEGNLIQAEWQLATAWTSLRRALGSR